ncbi:MAG: hypothetical protein ACFFB2_17875 [Promethearchaeota archaeon]
MELVHEFLAYNKKIIDFEQTLLLDSDDEHYRTYNLRQLRKISSICHKIRHAKYNNIDQHLEDILTVIYKMKQRTKGCHCLLKMKARMYKKVTSHPELRKFFSSRLPFLYESIEFYQSRLDLLIKLEREGSYLQYLFKLKLLN